MPSEVAFSVVDGGVEQLVEVTLEEIGLKERQDLQRWIETYPEIVGPDLLVLTTEFDRWEFGTERVRDRLDVLLLDSAGSLVVAELKRGEAPDTVDLQALKYAAYCSQLTVEDIVGDYARHYGVSAQEASERIFEHAPSLEESGTGPVKVRLIAEAFRPSVTSMVLWLRDYELDIGCTEISARRLPDGNAVLTSRQLLPLPAAEDYLVKRRRREKSEEQRESAGRRRNVVTELLEADAIEPGSQLTLNFDAFTRAEREVVGSEVQRNPALGMADWTGLALNKALRWHKDGATYSATGLVLRILQHCGFTVRSAPGPGYWRIADGRNLVELAASLVPQSDLSD